MNLDVALYGPLSIPLESVRSFVLDLLPQVGWGKLDEDEVVLDVGCGPGGTTKELILPLFTTSSRIFAIDAMPGMIDLAKKQNSTAQIEYFVADMEDWSVLERWKNQITKLVSILCFHWLRDQKNAFHNVHHLLRKGGQAAFLFVLRSTFHASVLDMQNSPRWSHLFKGVENFVPESQLKGHDASHYVKMLEKIGFEVLYCRSVEKSDVLDSDKQFQELFLSVCVLRKYIPAEQLEEFETDYINSILQKNVRDSSGKPVHKAIFMEIVVRKKD